MAEIQIEGRHVDIEKVSYDVFALDGRREKGDHNYSLIIPLSELEDKLKQSYDEFRDFLNTQVKDKKIIEEYGENPWPDFENLVRNEGLLKKLLLDYYRGYPILSLFLISDKPEWLVKSMDNVKITNTDITILGTVVEKRNY